jgi:hypothetical protein
MSNNQLHNPFDESENLNAWFDLDDKYNSAKKRHFDIIKSYYKTKFQSMKTAKPLNNYSNNYFIQHYYLLLDNMSTYYKTTINTRFKQAIFISTLVFTLFTSLVVGAQQLAPDNYKPTNIINQILPIKKEESGIKSQSPETNLSQNNSNFQSIKFTNCGLIINYPDQINGIEVEVTSQFYEEKDGKLSYVSLQLKGNTDSEKSTIISCKDESIENYKNSTFKGKSLNSEEIDQLKNKLNLEFVNSKDNINFYAIPTWQSENRANVNFYNTKLNKSFSITANIKELTPHFSQKQVALDQISITELK